MSEYIDTPTFEAQDHTRKWHTEIPNIVFELGLDPFVFSAYCHIKKAAGDQGTFFKSNATLCKEMGCGETKLKEIKKELTASRELLNGKSLIKISRRKKVDNSFLPDLIQIVNIWDESYEFHKEKRRNKESEILNTEKIVRIGGGSPNDLPLGRQTTYPGSPGAYKEEPIEEEPIFKKTTNPSLPPTSNSKGLVGGLSKEMKIYPCLQKIDMPEKDKIRMTSQYDEDLVSKSISHCTKPSFKPNTTIEASLFYFCKNPSHMTDTKKEAEEKKKKQDEQTEEKIILRKSYAEKIVKLLWNHCKDILKESCIWPRAELEYMSIKDEKVYYTNNYFKSEVEHLLRKFELPIPKMILQIP